MCCCERKCQCYFVTVSLSAVISSTVVVSPSATVSLSAAISSTDVSSTAVFIRYHRVSFSELWLCNTNTIF